MSHVCTPSLVGEAFPVLELKFSQIPFQTMDYPWGSKNTIE